jgi:hypothetical protein
MLRWTDAAHPDFADLSSSLEWMEELCWQVNERQRLEDAEKQRVSALFALGTKIEPKLQVRICAQLARADCPSTHFQDLTGSPDRYVCPGIEGPVLAVEHDKEELRERYYFLLSDLMIITKPVKGRYHLKHVLELATTRFRDIPGVTAVLRGKDAQHVVEILAAEADHSSVLVFPTGDAKARALESISRMQVQIQQQQQVATSTPPQLH